VEPIHFTWAASVGVNGQLAPLLLLAFSQPSGLPFLPQPQRKQPPLLAALPTASRTVGIVADIPTQRYRLLRYPTIFMGRNPHSFLSTQAISEIPCNAVKQLYPRLHTLGTQRVQMSTRTPAKQRLKQWRFLYWRPVTGHQLNLHKGSIVRLRKVLKPLNHSHLWL